MGRSVFAGPAFGPAAGAVFGLLLLAACAWDVRTRRIPNWLVAATAASGLAYAVAAASVLPGAAAAAAGLTVGFVLWVPFYALRMLGAGDVKFFAAASAWLGAGLALRAALVAALAGGVLALAWLAAYGGVRRAAAHAALQAAHPGVRLPAPAPERARKLPYGVAMALGLAAAAWFPHLIF
ncbi:hypothetical protein tb265_16130 [Gemmatimonadetes bacterium T265]|nr:hypothetical protein tb265_16130 [Gemmatimonadetes bacterium T265]